MFDTIIDALTRAHALAGTVALLAFWCAAFARKGSTLHRMIGRAYLITMIVVVVTIVPLTLSYFAEGQWAGGTFLLYLALLVSQASLVAWRAIRYKRDFDRFAGPVFVGGTIALTLAGLTVSIIGVMLNAWLLIVFGLIGPLGGLQARTMLREAAGDRKWWLKQHYGAMIGNGVATHIAFLQIGLMRLFPSLGDTLIQHLAWFGPLAIGFAAGFWLDRRYGRAPVPPARRAASA
jgi:hypothetical protein